MEARRNPAESRSPTGRPRRSATIEKVDVSVIASSSAIFNWTSVELTRLLLRAQLTAFTVIIHSFHQILKIRTTRFVLLFAASFQMLFPISKISMLMSICANETYRNG